MPDLVPFGKYKNQPIEVLAQDAGYCEWLMNQGWVAQRYPTIHTLIINHFGEPSETPEHNRLQLRFLDRTFRAQCSHAILAAFQRTELPLHMHAFAMRAPVFEVQGLDVIWRIGGWLVQSERQTTHEKTALWYAYWISRHIAQFPKHKGTLETRINDLRMVKRPYFLEQLQACDILNLFKNTDSDGVVIVPEQCPTIAEVEEAYAPYDFAMQNTIQDTRYAWDTHPHEDIAVECKPSLGDDYPAILRTLKRMTEHVSLRHHRAAVVYEDWNVLGGDRKDVATFFRQSNIVLLSVTDIENTAPLAVATEDELPNPLELYPWHD